MNKYTLLYSFFYSRRLATLGVFALDFFANLFTLALPVVLAQTYALLFDYQSARGRLLAKFGIPQQNDFLFWLLLFISLVILKAIFDLLRNRSRGRLSEDFSYWLRQLLFRHHLRMNLPVYEERGAGRYLLRFSGDMGSAQQFVFKGILQFSADALLVVMGVILLFLLDFYLGSIVLSGLVLLWVTVLMFNRTIGKLEQKRRDLKSSILAFINLRLLNITSLKTFNRETPERSQFEKRAAMIRKASYAYHNLVALIEALIPFVIYAILAIVLITAYFWKQRGEAFELEKIFALILILISWRNILQRTLRIGLVWKKGAVSLEKISTLLQQPLEKGYACPEIEIKDQPLRAYQMAMQFGQRVIFKNLSFTLHHGEVGLITGDSGSGKTTLIKLLAGLYPPTSGDLYFGDYPYRELHPKSIRRQLAFVSEALPLYGKTIGEAISYSRRQRDKARKRFSEWQRLFPELQHLQFNTPLREFGRLSGSQLQLLQWLRALFTNKPFLILDEPFQSLNVATAQKIWLQIPSGCGVLLLSNNADLEQVTGAKVTWRLSLEDFSSVEKNCRLSK